MDKKLNSISTTDHFGDSEHRAYLRLNRLLGFNNDFILFASALVYVIAIVTENVTVFSADPSLRSWAWVATASLVASMLIDLYYAVVGVLIYRSTRIESIRKDYLTIIIVEVICGTVIALYLAYTRF